MKKNSISVIIPTYNRPKMLKKCLYSLLNQTIKPLEIIIIDNSRNKTAQKVFQSFKKKPHKIIIKYYSQLRKGTTYARNLGIKKSKGKYLLFIDDDCIADKFLIENYSKVLKKNLAILGNAKNASNNNYSVIENLTTKFFFQKGLIKRKKDYYSFFLDSKNFAIKRSFVTKNNLYFNNKYARYSIYEDIEFGLRINFFLEKRILFKKSALVYHYGRDNFWNHLKREWRKGKGFSYFLNDFTTRYQKQIIKKGEIKFLTNLYRGNFYGYLDFIKKNVKQYPQFKKIFLILLAVFDQIIFFLGFIYESFFIKKPESKKTKQINH